MDTEQFTHIVEQIKPHTSFLYFHVKGEPLMHKRLEAFLDICYKNGLRVNLTTNGTLLKKQQALLLENKAVRQVNISLHSFNEQDSIDNIDNQEYIQTALEFARLANERNIYVVLRLWNLSKDNQTDENSLAIMKEIERKFDLATPLIEHMGGRQSVKIAKNTFVGWEQEFVWPTLENEFVSDTGFCYGMRHQIAILVDGTVVPCCLDANGEAPLGNIFKQKFADIIQTKRAKAIKHGFENRLAVDPLCKRCSFRTKFD